MAKILLFIFLFLFSNTCLSNNQATSIPDDIKSLFPSATRIEVSDPNLAVTSVYQLSQLLGYVFQSDDFTDFVGFSGKTINLLIALDPQGILVDLKVINHHEPIFLHGLGEEPLFEFVRQYQGHSIKERFIIGRRHQNDGITYFDGITKATVSVLVINDTIISAALTVARKMLDGFSKRANAVLVEDTDEDLSFEQLIEQGYIFHWQLSEQKITTIQPLLAYLFDLDSTLPAVDLYFAFVNVPLIGRNILGIEEYQRLITELKPGEQALMILSRGQFSFIRDDFIPQTVPERLAVSQGKFPVDIRDIDFYSYYDPNLAGDVPSYQALKLFRIKSQSGFEVSQKMSVGLGITYQQSFMVTKRQWFTVNLKLPSSLFLIVPVIEAKIEPLWQRIWKNRALEIAILVAFLSLVLTFFIRIKYTATTLFNYRWLRPLCLGFTLVFIGGYAQGQLSVVNIYTLLLSLQQGFRLEVFLLDPIIFILWGFVFVSLFFWGRALYCGWLCPFGALQEFISYIAVKLRVRQYKISRHHQAQKIKYVILILLVGCSFYSLTLAEQLAEIEPFKTSITLFFVRYWPFVLYAIILLVVSLKIHKFYCRYLCPLGAALAVTGYSTAFKWIPRRKECGSPCQLCRQKKCGIDAIKNDGSVNYQECIGCYECVVTIESPTLCVINKYTKRKNV